MTASSLRPATVSAVTRALGVVPLYERARPILETLQEGSFGSQKPGVLTGAIEFNGVTFGYTADTPPVLKELSFTIEPGEYVAISGLKAKVKTAHLVKTGAEVKVTQDEFQTRFTGLPQAAPDYP